MRQNPDLLTMLERTNASTCGFFAPNGRCDRGFWNLPHTSVFEFGNAGKNRDLSTRPWFYASTACSFVVKKRVGVDGF